MSLFKRSAPEEWSTSEKALVGVGIALVVIAGALTWEFQLLNAMPIATVPMPKMPAANAFDDYVAATSAIIDSHKIGYAISTQHLPSISNPADHEYTLAEKEALVHENALQLKRIRASLRKPYLNPPIRSFLAQMPYYSSYRSMARLLVLDGQVAAAHNDYGTAVNADLDAVHMGIEIPHGSPIIGELVGIVCQTVGRKPIWDDLDHLTANEARSAVWRLEKIQSRAVSPADVLQEEKWVGQAGLLEIFRDSNWRGKFAAMASEDGNSHNQQWGMAMLFTSKRKTFDNYTHYLDQAAENARLPYAAHPKAPVMPTDVFNKTLVPVFTGVQFKDLASSQTQNVLLLTALALRAYREDNGFYPDTLNALAPTYLSKVPDDPFALSGPLKYIRTGARYILYSIGPDGIDDSGKAIFDGSIPRPKTPGANDRRYGVKQDSKGDIVAGINKF